MSETADMQRRREVEVTLLRWLSRQFRDVALDVDPVLIPGIRYAVKHIESIADSLEQGRES